MLRFLISLIFALACSGVSAQVVPPGPAYQAFIDNPANFIKLRLGIPQVIRGYSNDFEDVPESFIKYGTNEFYAYNSGTCTVGAAVTSMTALIAGTGYGPSQSGPNTCLGALYNGVNNVVGTNLTVSMQANQITPISPVQRADQCGAWMETTYKYGSTWYALVHNEGPCNYSNGSSNYSASMWTSSTGAPGSWSPMTVASLSNGTIEASLQPVTTTPNQDVGMGDCSMIPDNIPTYMYLYCGYYDTQNGLTGWHIVVGRAPINNLGPGNWNWLYRGCFCSPALGTPFNSTTQLPQADLLPWTGSWVVTMPGSPFKAISAGQNHVTTPLAVGVGTVSNAYPRSNINGNTILFSTDYFHFSQPLVILNWDFQQFFGRPTNYDLFLYPTFRNDVDGSSLLGLNSFNYTYMWTPPNNSLSNRYNVVQPVTKTTLTLAQKLQGIPQVGVNLETWYNSGNSHYRSTTVNPYAGISSDGVIETGWATSASLGYMMTTCPSSGVSGKNGDVQYLCDAVGSKIASQIEECWNSSNDDYQLHIDTNGATGSCPGGWTHVRTAGWAYKTAQPFGTNPIYSCSLTSGGYHFSSNSATCGGQTVIGLLGYALAN